MLPLLPLLQVQTADGFPAVPSASDAVPGARPDATAGDWLQKRSDPGPGPGPAPAQARRDAAAERSACLAPAFRRAAVPWGAAAWRKEAVLHRPDEVRFAERSISSVAALTDVRRPSAWPARELRSQLAPQLRYWTCH
jgi:hypothetical protein